MCCVCCRVTVCACALLRLSSIGSVETPESSNCACASISTDCQHTIRLLLVCLLWSLACAQIRSTDQVHTPLSLCIGLEETPIHQRWSVCAALRDSHVLVMLALHADSRYIVSRINAFKPGPDRHFVLGLPTGGLHPHHATTTTTGVPSHG